MPWTKVAGSRVSDCSDDEIAVVKENEDGSPDLTEVEGCHDNESQADDQIAALEAQEESSFNLSVERSSDCNCNDDTDKVEDQWPGLFVTRRSIGKSDDTGKAEPQELSVNGSRPPAYFEGSLSEIDDPTSETMRLINEQSDIELGPDDVVVFEDYVAHDQPPSVGARVPLGFSLDALEKLAEDAREGRTFNLHHNKPRHVGSTFDAEIVRDEVNEIAGNWLKLSWYSPTKDASEQRRQDIADMSTGVLKHTSIETRHGRWERREMDPSDENDSRQWFEIQDNPEADETDRLILEGAARVHLGAITGAGSS